MKARSPISVLNLYQWLPGYGENSVSVVLTDADLIVDVLYDSNSDAEERISLNFSKTCFFCMSSFPGVDLIILSMRNMIIYQI
jgi:hypothetical protein